MFAFAIVLALLSQLTATLAFVPTGTPCVPIGTPTYSGHLDYTHATPSNFAVETTVTTVQLSTPTYLGHLDSTRTIASNYAVETGVTASPTYSNRYGYTRSVSAPQALETCVTIEKPNIKDLSGANKVVYTASELLCSKSGMFCSVAKKYSVRAVHFIETPTVTEASVIDTPALFPAVLSAFTVTSKALFSSQALVSHISQVSGPLIKLVYSLSLSIPLSTLDKQFFRTIRSNTKPSLELLFGSLKLYAGSLFFSFGLTAFLAIVAVTKASKLALTHVPALVITLSAATPSTLRKVLHHVDTAVSEFASASVNQAVPSPSTDNTSSNASFDTSELTTGTSSNCCRPLSTSSHGSQCIKTNTGSPVLPSGPKLSTSSSPSDISTPPMAGTKTSEDKTSKTETTATEINLLALKIAEIEEALAFLDMEILEKNVSLEAETPELRILEIEAAPSVETSEVNVPEQMTPEIEDSFLGFEILEMNASPEVETTELMTTENEDDFLGIEILEKNASSEVENHELRTPEIEDDFLGFELLEKNASPEAEISELSEPETTAPVEISKVNTPELITPEIEDDFLGIEILEKNAFFEVETIEMRETESETASPEIETSEIETSEIETSEIETSEVRTPVSEAISPEIETPEIEDATPETPEIDENEKANKELKELLISRGRPGAIPFEYTSEAERQLDIQVSGVYSLTVGNADITKPVDVSEDSTPSDKLSSCTAILADTNDDSKDKYIFANAILTEVLTKMDILTKMHEVCSGVKFEPISEEYTPEVLSAQIKSAKHERNTWLLLCWKVFMACVDMENRGGVYDVLSRLSRSKQNK